MLLQKLPPDLVDLSRSPPPTLTLLFPMSEKWPHADSVVYEPLGGKHMLELLANAHSFNSSKRVVGMPNGETLHIFRAMFDMDKGRRFLYTHSVMGGLNCVSFENRPQPHTLKGIALSILMRFKPTTPLLRTCYVLPCSPSDLSPRNFKDIFRSITHIELDLW